jgi:hypothetical protein
VQYLQNALAQYEQKKAECLQRFQYRDLNDPIFKMAYNNEMNLYNNTMQHAFMIAVDLLQPDAKARVLAPYHGMYDHLLNF